MNDHTLRGILEAISRFEANMNYLLRKHKEGKVQNDHLYDMIKTWALVYKMTILIGTIHRFIADKDPNVASARMIMLGIRLSPQAIEAGDRLQNMFETLIEGYHDDKSCDLQDEGEDGSQEPDDIRA